MKRHSIPVCPKTLKVGDYFVCTDTSYFMGTRHKVDKVEADYLEACPVFRYPWVKEAFADNGIRLRFSDTPTVYVEDELWCAMPIPSMPPKEWYQKHHGEKECELAILNSYIKQFEYCKDSERDYYSCNICSKDQWNFSPIRVSIHRLAMSCWCDDGCDYHSDVFFSMGRIYPKKIKQYMLDELLKMKEQYEIPTVDTPNANI